MTAALAVLAWFWKSPIGRTILIALAGGFVVYGVLRKAVGIRLTQEQEYYGADLSVHKIGATSGE